MTHEIKYDRQYIVKLPTHFCGHRVNYYFLKLLSLVVLNILVFETHHPVLLSALVVCGYYSVSNPFVVVVYSHRHAHVFAVVTMWVCILPPCLQKRFQGTVVFRLKDRVRRGEFIHIHHVYDFAAVGRWWSRGPLACAVGHTRFELFVKVSYNACAVSLRHFLEDSFQVRQSVVLRGLDSPPVWYVDGDNKYMAGWATKPYPTYALTFWSKRLEFLSGSTR